MKFQHFIMTRFNLPSIGKGCPKHSKKPEWVEGRFDTYEKISIPSFLGQTNQNFRVLVLMSTVYTPKPLWKRAENWAPGKIIPIWLRGKHGKHGKNNFPLDEMYMIPNIVKPFLNGDEDYLITSMCDSDDAFHCRYVERVQKEADPRKRELLVFSQGCVLDNLSSTVYMQRNNQFHMYPTLVEPIEGFKTVLFRKHPRMHLIAPPRFIEVDEPYFLRGVDGSNVMTKIRQRNRQGGDYFPLSELRNFSFNE